MNEFDHFMKRSLRVRYYVSYADDFIINESENYLESIVFKIAEFLEVKLKFALHPNKVFITTYASGINFLDWINFPHYRVLGTSTKH